MKPISLKLSGLQSYREMQEIDFTALCDTGLFGIFGPTGSGKSTILDAITLAMYGKVGRAFGGTQGIMNHSEDALFVSFTFELSSANGSERYRVERRFKRQNELSVSNTISRFIEITSEREIVLADKLADVTRCVEEKIGLKMDDFTRAVVLPQGKFAEFLSLKGAERRQMLQRLFHLEKYGDLLAQKLSRRVKESDQKLKELAAEQQGLGNASEEALQAAEHAMKTAAVLANSRRDELGEAEKKVEGLAKVRELAMERGQRSVQLTELKELDGTIAQLEAKLVHSAAAEAIRPALTSWKEARQLSMQRQEAAVYARKASEAATEEAVSATEALAAATSALSLEEPGLLIRINQLEQAVLLQSECNSLLEELNQLRASQESSGVKRQSVADEIQKEEQLLAKAQGRQRELEQLLKDCEVKASERQSIQAAAGLGKELIRAQEQLAKAEAEEIELRGKMESSVKLLYGIALEENTVKDRCVDLAKLALDNALQLNELDVILANHMNTIANAESQLRTWVKESEQSVWLSRLAEQLQKGQPCPVCGSEHHPIHEAHGQGQEILNVGDRFKQLEQLSALLATVKELNFSVSRDLEISRSVIEQLNDSNALNYKNDSLDKISFHSKKEAAASLQIDMSYEVLEISKLHGAVQTLADQHALLRPQLEGLQKEARTFIARLNELQPRLAAVRAEAAGAEEFFKQAAERSTNCREELRAKEKEWNAEHSGISVEAAAGLLEQIVEKDRKAEDIKQRLALSVPFIEEKNLRLSQLGKDLIELDKELLQREGQEQGKQSLYQEKHSRLSSWIGEDSVDKLLPEATQRLAMLRKQVEECQNRQAIAAASSNHAAQSNALALQADASAREQEEKLHKRWLEELEVSPFQNEAEATDSFVASELANEYALTVKNHRDRERELEINLRELDDKLAGRIVTEEEWEASTLALNNAKSMLEEALQFKARSERDLEDLMTRHVRWKELEQQRLNLAREFDLLGKLQSSLRGNAFVEYVAEEQLLHVSHAASQRLRNLTKQRYSLEIDSGGGFVICDDANGGVKRPVATLSGGETFLASLALALALSAQIQLRGQYPLQFFFLDEGFGTLDPELLDTVITSLEHLHDDHLSVGIISHVAELRSRLARKLIVIPAESGGEGSRVIIENI
ncbi:Nuclease SbcCD subunit C [compost metagenome]